LLRAGRCIIATGSTDTREKTEDRRQKTEKNTGSPAEDPPPFCLAKRSCGGYAKELTPRTFAALREAGGWMRKFALHYEQSILFG